MVHNGPMKYDDAHHRKHTIWSVSTFILRVLIGLLLGATAVGKGLDPRGFAEVVGTYQVFPKPLWLPIAMVMIVVESVLAFMLLQGRRTRVGALASSALHMAFMIWAAMALLRGLHIPNCGCFGVFLSRPLTWGTVGEDGFMVAVSLLLWWTARGSERRTNTHGERASTDG